MRMMNELNHMFLYPASNKVYMPINEKNRRKSSAILLLSPKFETSCSMINLPFLHNPNLFNSLYIDGNAMAYIDGSSIDDFDEAEEEQLSESLFSSPKKTTFKFDEDVSLLDKKNIEIIFCKEYVNTISKLLYIKKIPEEIKISVYPTAYAMKNKASQAIINMHNGNLYGYSENNHCHVLSRTSYDEDICGPYEVYLKTQLVYHLINSQNSNIPYTYIMAISYMVSGAINFIPSDKVIEVQAFKLAKSLDKLTKIYGYKFVGDFIETGDIYILLGYSARKTKDSMKKMFSEAELSYSERQNLPSSDFGVPSKRKFPIHDEEHVRAAIRMFNKCDRDEEAELAANIIKRIKKFGMTDIKVSASNQFKKYYTSPKNESFVDSDYGDIMKICNDLDNNELSRITFYDTYRNSEFVIKRIIHRIGPDPAGFLDVYQYPSCPEIAQIVIAVSKQFRGQGIARKMVDELLSSDLHKTHNFTMYYWTAHQDNDASIYLSTSSGFEDTGKIDKYGRRVFIKQVSIPDNMVKEASKCTESGSVEEAILENASILCEIDDRFYTQKMRKYLYAERLKKRKDIISLYTRAKELVPSIKNTYINLKMYKSFNLFVDLSYYHGLFLKNNNVKLDKGVELYFEFLNRLINNDNLSKAGYNLQTIFVPVDRGIWDEPKDADICDFRTTLNPISVICRLIRTNPTLLKEKWGNKRFLFVSNKGYFTIDFNKFEMKNLSRLRNNINKLRSTEPIKIEDDYEVDTSMPNENSDTPKARAAKMIDKVEKGTSIKLDSISNNSSKTRSVPHLSISTNTDAPNSKERFAAIIVHPDGPEGFDQNSKVMMSKIPHLSMYCAPKE